MGDDWEAEHDKLIMLEENDNEDFNYDQHPPKTPTQFDQVIIIIIKILIIKSFLNQFKV